MALIEGRPAASGRGYEVQVGKTIMRFRTKKAGNARLAKAVKEYCTEQGHCEVKCYGSSGGLDHHVKYTVTGDGTIVAHVQKSPSPAAAKPRKKVSVKRTRKVRRATRTVAGTPAVGGLPSPTLALAASKTKRRKAKKRKTVARSATSTSAPAKTKRRKSRKGKRKSVARSATTTAASKTAKSGTKRKVSPYAKFVKANYHKVSHLPNKQRMRALAKLWNARG